MASSKGRLFFKMEWFIFKRGKTRPHATLGQRGSSWRTWGSILPIASNVSQVLKIKSNCICLTSFKLFLCSLSELFLRLWPHHLLVNSHLGWDQVILQITYTEYFDQGFGNEDISTAHVTRGTWTWVRFATWPPPLWQCGNQASSRLTETRQQATSMQHQGRWGGTSLRGRGSS